jgi:endogenous inhibitor of DNA gyrase (YacG/DUF329 family)
MYKNPSDYKKSIRVGRGRIRGYTYFYDPEHPLALQRGSVYLHRHIASMKLGRWLGEGEIVHHKDGDKSNNAPDNLEVLTASRHATLHSEARGHYITRLKRCRLCGREFRSRSKTNIFCSTACSGMSQRRVERPSKEQLRADIDSMSWLAIGRKYGVSDNAVRKWAKRYGLGL